MNVSFNWIIKLWKGFVDFLKHPPWRSSSYPEIVFDRNQPNEDALTIFPNTRTRVPIRIRRPSEPERYQTEANRRESERLRRERDTIARAVLAQFDNPQVPMSMGYVVCNQGDNVTGTTGTTETMAEITNPLQFHRIVAYHSLRGINPIAATFNRNIEGIAQRALESINDRLERDYASAIENSNYQSEIRGIMASGRDDTNCFLSNERLAELRRQERDSSDFSDLHNLLDRIGQDPADPIARSGLDNRELIGMPPPPPEPELKTMYGYAQENSERNTQERLDLP